MKATQVSRLSLALFSLLLLFTVGLSQADEASVGPATNVEAEAPEATQNDQEQVATPIQNAKPTSDWTLESLAIHSFFGDEDFTSTQHCPPASCHACLSMCETGGKCLPAPEYCACY